MTKADALIVTGKLQVRLQGQEQLLTELSKLQKYIAENDFTNSAIEFGALEELIEDSGIDTGEYIESLHEFISEFEEIFQREQEEKLNMTFSDLMNASRINARAYNVLKGAGKETVRDVAKMTREELRKIKNIGNKTFNEVIDLMEELGFELRSE